jgi:Flp pilus assembly protein TadD
VIAMPNMSILGYRTHIAPAIFIALVAAFGIDIKLGHSQTKEAEALTAQSRKLYQQGRYSEAIPLAQRILEIREKSLGPDHTEVATALNNLAAAYKGQGRYVDAEPL